MRQTPKRWGNRPRSYNGKVGLMLCCPITTKIKNYLFVMLSRLHDSAVLAYRIKSLDWRARAARFKGNVTPAELARVREIARLVIG